MPSTTSKVQYIIYFWSKHIGKCTLSIYEMLIEIIQYKIINPTQPYIWKPKDHETWFTTWNSTWNFMYHVVIYLSICSYAICLV